jgi:hypothetical protein
MLAADIAVHFVFARYLKGGAMAARAELRGTENGLRTLPG